VFHERTCLGHRGRPVVGRHLDRDGAGHRAHEAARAPANARAAEGGRAGLEGLSEEDARQNLKVLGLVFLVGERKAASGAAPGTVVEQTPAAGQQLEARGSVTVVLVREPPKVPSVVGRTLAEATALLAQCSYKLEQAGPIADAHVPKGNVVSQLPEADKLQETDKPIVVRVSSGPGEFEVPRLLGRNIENVKTLAKRPRLHAQDRVDRGGRNRRVRRAQPKSRRGHQNQTGRRGDRHRESLMEMAALPPTPCATRRARRSRPSGEVLR
jgi:PASTA domain